MENNSTVIDPIGLLVPRRKLAAELGVCVRTIVNHEADPAFPKSVLIKKRRYFPRRAIDAWKAGLVTRSMHGGSGDA